MRFKSLALAAAFVLTSWSAASAQNPCPAANPNDSVADDTELNNCLAGGGTIVLSNGTPGYIVAQSLQLRTNGVTLMGGGPDAATIIADPWLPNPMFWVAEGTTGYTISNVFFNGNLRTRWGVVGRYQLDAV